MTIWPKSHRPSKLNATLASLVGLTMLGVSLTHLAHGIGKTTGDSVVLSWALAIGIDAGIVVLKMATVICSTRPVWRDLKNVVQTGLIITLLMSAGMNIRSYTEGQTWTSLEFWIGVSFGLFVPYCVWLMSQVAAKVWIEGHVTTVKRGRPKKKA